MGYRARFEAMVEQLQSNPRVDVLKVEFGEAASDQVIVEATALAGGALPPAMAELAREMNGFGLHWQPSDAALLNDGVEGCIELLPLTGDEGVFADWRDVLWFEDDSSAATRRIKPFDFFVAAACMALYPVPGAMEVHYHYCNEELHPTGYQFDRYIDLLLEARGFLYWQDTLCTERTTSQSAQDFRRLMPSLFPGFDATIFRPATTAGEIALYSE